EVYARLDETSSTIQGLAAGALVKEGVPHRVSTAGNMFSVFFTDRDVANYDDAKTQNVAAYKAFFHAMLAGGVYLPPSAYEAWFSSTAIDEEALDRLAAVLPVAARAAAQAPGEVR
ncbi:MAG TPA: aspartate aminotransferase family protein, partial [Micromonosporaceae bacterium]